MDWAAFWEGILKPVRAAAFLISHTGMACGTVGMVYCVERFIGYLWSDRDPLLMDIVPLRYLFDLIDLGFIAIFGVRGMLAAWRAFRD